MLLVAVLALSGCYAAPLTRATQRVLDDHAVGGEVVHVHLAREPDHDARPATDLRTLLAQPLDARRASEVALLASPDIQADLETLGVSRADLLTASLLPNPELDVEYRPGRASGGDEIEGRTRVVPCERVKSWRAVRSLRK
ncbi:MAG: hypothetical protein J0L92_40085 [Deltaproteobacteria bacterium]|nr:hypothetical protein [Deltaproteobacteria bacterium]